LKHYLRDSILKSKESQVITNEIEESKNFEVIKG